MDFWKILLLLMHCRNVIATSGSFWHISDLHLDPEYQKSSDPLKVCPSAGTQPVISAGTWGDYLCDSPWILINSSIYTMKKILPDPDFILWTGDDTPHVPDEKLGDETVLEIIKKLTNLIRRVFPDTQVYPAMGNHDFHPKNQLPVEENKIYNVTAELWRPWLEEPSIQKFRTGAFYSQLLPGLGPRRRIIVLNTNLYYESNNRSVSLEDPGGQFQWLQTLLTKASETGEKDIVTYYLNLTHANMGTPEWKKEYSLTEAYQIPDGSVRSMHLLLEKLMKDESQLQKYYRYNSVQYDNTFCDDSCQTDHICAIREVDFERYSQCVTARSAAAATPILDIFLFCPTIGLITLGFLDVLSKLGHK